MRRFLWHPGLTSGQLFSSLIGAITLAVFLIVVELSLGTLIFSGSLSTFVANGIGLALFGTAALTLVVTFTSSFPGTMASPQDSPAAILALMAAGIAARMVNSSPQSRYYTVLAAIILTSLLTGLFFILLGRFRLGRLVRFVPYPVMGGFLAGTGWLLFQGGMSLLTGTSFSLGGFSSLWSARSLMDWLPGLAFGVLLMMALRRFSQFWIMPAILLGGIAVFYISLLVLHISVAEAGQRGWLLGPFPAGALWRPFPLAGISQVDWGALAGQLDKAGTILLISVVSLLLNASGLELALRTDLDLDHELQTAGLGNLLAGLGGGMVGYHALTDTVIVHKIGAGQTRLTGLVIAAACAAVLLAGASFLSYFPRPILGGLLLFMGLSFLVEWVYDAWFKLPRMDYALVLLILVIVGTFGFLPGVAAGMGIAAALFIVSYSRVSIIKHTLSGSTFHSRVDRSPSNRELLRTVGDQVVIFALHGFIFFGTLQTLLEQCRVRIQNAAATRLRYLIIDFRQVVGVDSSAVSGFLRLFQMSEPKGISLILAHLSPEVAVLLERAGLAETGSDAFRAFSDLDRAMEWCENRILAGRGLHSLAVSDGLEGQMHRVFHHRRAIKRFFSYLDRQELPAGHYLMKQGEPANSLYFIESGMAAVQLELPGGEVMRLRVLRSGTFAGEVGVYLNRSRTASVVTTQPSTVYCLSRNAMDAMEVEDPDVSAALHKLLAHQLADRLAENNKLIEAML